MTTLLSGRARRNDAAPALFPVRKRKKELRTPKVRSSFFISSHRPNRRTPISRAESFSPANPKASLQLNQLLLTGPTCCFTLAEPGLRPQRAHRPAEGFFGGSFPGERGARLLRERFSRCHAPPRRITPAACRREAPHWHGRLPTWSPPFRACGASYCRGSA